MAVRPMFPLESVLVPGMVLPLLVFEDRYRAMVVDCMAADRQFGVTLIERGSEVGGGDVRSTIGTVAELIRADRAEDGRWGVVAIGVRRIRVERWLEDDPYPRAEVTDWPDEEPTSGDDLFGLFREQEAALRRVLGMSAELGRPADPTFDISDEPLAGSYHLTVLAPVGPLDRQRLLADDGPRDRLVRLGALLAEEAADLEAQLGGS